MTLIAPGLWLICAQKLTKGDGVESPPNALAPTGHSAVDMQATPVSAEALAPEATVAQVVPDMVPSPTGSQVLAPSGSARELRPSPTSAKEE